MCMSCGMKGDAVGLVKHVDGGEWNEAYRRCKDIVGGDSRPVRAEPKRGGFVSSRKRDNGGSGTYVPARLR